MENTNFVEIITQTINTLFQNLFSSIDNSLYSILDDITFIDTDIMNNSFFENIFSSHSNGILLIANSLLLGFIIFYSVRYFLCIYTFTPIQSPYQFIFKLIIICIFMNFSFFICEKIIFLVSSFSLSIRHLGELFFHKEVCFSGLISHLNSTITIGKDSFNLFSLDGIIKTLISVGLVNLIFSYSLRYVMIKVFILLSPFSILSLSVQTTSWLFKTWFRSFLSLLFIQIFISFILLIVFSINFNSNLFSKFMYIGSIYALIKGNSYLRDLMGGISTEINTNFNLISKTLGR